MKKLRYIYLLFILLFAGCKSHVISHKQSENYPVINQQSENREAEKIIAPYKEELEKTMNTVIGESEKELTTGSPEGTLGNFICDLCLRLGNEKYGKQYSDTADFVLLNNGGFRTFMPKGAITRGKVFEIMPFENELVVVTLSVEQTVQLFEYIAVKTVKNGTRKQGVPVSGNVLVEILDKTPIEVLVDDSRLKGRTYKVITTDYLANGGDNMSFFLSSLKVEKLNLKLRDAILEEMKDLSEKDKKITANLDKRIRYAN